MNTEEALNSARKALAHVIGFDPTVGELVALDAVAQLETSRGEGWKGIGKGSFNMGAIQCGSGWKGERFSYVDTHPNSDGTSTPYRIDFRKYPTAQAGLEDLAKVMFINRGRECVRQAARANNWWAVSISMHDTGYYEGYGATVDVRIGNHCRALLRGINHDLLAIGIPLPHVELPGIEIPIILKRGDGERNGKREAVKLLQQQHILKLAADGEFGQFTERAVVAFQKERSLTIDDIGIVGPQTWRELLEAT